MKLNVKNFTGKLANGQDYKIVFENTKEESISEFCLRLSVYTNNMTYSKWWLYDGKLSVVKWYKKEDYIKCLKECLLKLEDNLQVSLLKSEMKITA